MADLPVEAVAPPHRERDSFRIGVALLLLIYLGFTQANIFALPPLNGPDELHHLAYVRILREYHTMPILPRFAAPGEPRVAEQAQHPPLYYAILAAVSPLLPDYNTGAGQRALKLLSVLMGLVGLLAFATCVREMWPDDDVAALAAFGFLALLPMYWVMTSLINNTAGSLAASGLALMFLRRAVAQPERRRLWLWTGLTVALGMVAKITAAWLVPTVLVAILALWRQDRQAKAALARAGAAMLPPVVLVGAWLARNWLRFSEVMPERVTDRRYLPLGFETIFFLPLARNLFLLVMFVTLPLSALTPYWLLRTSLDHRAGEIIMVTFLVLLGPPLLALLFQWRHPIEGPPSYRRGLYLACGVGILTAWFIGMQALLHDWNTGLYAGRYAVDAAPALALLFGGGLRVLLPRREFRAAAAGFALLVLLALSLTIHVLMVVFFKMHGV